jgi:glycosyltransferase involved in cell wall biosynthesis
VRIISVSTDYPGPRNPRGGLFVQRRLAALARLEDVRVIHLEPWFPLLRPRTTAAAPNGYPDYPPAVRPGMFYFPGVLKGLDSYWVKKAVTPTIRALESEGPADLIDAHFGYPDGVGCVKAALELCRPVFITMRGLERPILRYHWRGSQLLWALRECTGIICVSHSLKELAVSAGIDPAKICVIPNAVDRVQFRPGSRDEARAALGIDRAARLIVCVGMLVHGKGQHLLLRALAQLRRRHVNLKLALIGGSAHEPKHPEKLRKMAGKFDLGDAVFMTGSLPTPQVVTWLRAADLFALPTFDEGCCNAILEAMACGLPVVTTPAGDNAVLVDPPRRGILVPIDDAEGLADSIEAALASSWDRADIAQYGVDYDWDEVARQTARFFRDRLSAVKA